MILFDIILKSARSYFRKPVEQKGERVSALSINKLNPNCWREEESWVEAADQRPCLRLCPKDTNFGRFANDDDNEEFIKEDINGAQTFRQCL